MVRTLVALTAALLLAPASASAALPVGHTVKRITVPGTLPQEVRAVDVHLWYPADAASFAQASTTVYRSALYGDTRIPAGWKPLSWSLDAKIAREAAIAQQGKPYPVIVFSTGNQNDPIDYGYTLELIAAAGFVVAAPSHANNSGDDVRIDFINQQAGTRLIPCNDGLPPRATFGTGDCSKTNVPNSIADRVRDVSYVLNALPEWLGSRVDVAQAGVFGHSRGTLTALTAAGGSTVWGVAPEPRVQAIMGVSIGMQALASQVSLTNVKTPALLAAGALDATSPPSVSKSAYDHHLERRQALRRDPERAPPDVRLDLLRPGAGVGGDRHGRPDRQEARQAHVRPDRDPCHFGADPGLLPVLHVHKPDRRHRTAVRRRTASWSPRPTSRSTGLTVDTVKQQVADLAVEFFAAKLARAAGGGVNGTVPATLSLTLGTRGVVRRVHARRRPYLRRELDRQRDLHRRRRRALGDRSQRGCHRPARQRRVLARRTAPGPRQQRRVRAAE